MVYFKVIGALALLLLSVKDRGLSSSAVWFSSSFIQSPAVVWLLVANHICLHAHSNLVWVIYQCTAKPCAHRPDYALCVDTQKSTEMN